MFSIWGFSSGAQTWTSGAPITESVRAANTAAWASASNVSLFVASGRSHTGQIIPKNQRYDLPANQWVEMAPMPTPRLGAAVAIVQDTLYTVGGLVTTPTGDPSRRVYKYDINANSWSTGANAPYPLTDTEAVAYQDSLIYVVGGYTGNTLLFNTKTNRWRTATPILPGGSLSWGAFSVRNDTLVHLCGAPGFQSPTYYNNVRIGVISQTDRAVITWSEAAPYPGETRAFFEAHPWRDGLIVVGGSTDNTFNTTSGECYHYNVGTDVWTALPPKPTPWVTGNSGSIYANGQWTLMCAGGYADGYLWNTEIFSEAALGTTKPDHCSLQDTKMWYRDSLKIWLCDTQAHELTLTLHDLQGKKLLVKRSGRHERQPEWSVPVSLQKGVYLCSVSDGQTTVTRKVTVR